MLEPAQELMILITIMNISILVFILNSIPELSTTETRMFHTEVVAWCGRLIKGTLILTVGFFVTYHNDVLREFLIILQTYILLFTLIAYIVGIEPKSSIARALTGKYRWAYFLLILISPILGVVYYHRS